jgi:hypothetical protein
VLARDAKLKRILSGAPGDNGPGCVAVLLESAEAVRAVSPDFMDHLLGVVGPYPSGAEHAFEVAAWLKDSRKFWWERAHATAESHLAPAEQLLALVRAVYDEISEPGFRGCRFLNTTGEFRDPDHPGRRESVAHLRDIHKQLSDLAELAGADKPNVLADELMLIIDGMCAMEAGRPVRAIGHSLGTVFDGRETLRAGSVSTRTSRR